MADSLFFTKGKGDKKFTLLCFVDDLAVLCKPDDQADAAINASKSKFALCDLGKIQNYVGLEITEIPNGYKVSQRNKTAQLLMEFIMEQCNGARTPMTTDFDKDDSPSTAFDSELYRSLVGSLMYLRNWSRPDISITCNLFACAASQPTQKHWLVAKRVLRYLRLLICPCI